MFNRLTGAAADLVRKGKVKIRDVDGVQYVSIWGE